MTTTINKQIKKMYKAYNNSTIETQAWWDFIATQDKEQVREVVNFMWDVNARLKSFLNGHYHRTKIRAFCNYHGYSDVYPYEVVRVVSDKCVEVREMQTNQIVFPKQFIVGGFSAHCADNWNQEYEYISNPNNPIKRLKKTKNGWGKGRFLMSEAPFKHYDYNF
jgi:hypothetical protein